MDTPIVPQPVKQCTRCVNEYPATAEYYHRDKRGKYGLVARCKKCCTEMQREYLDTEGGKATRRRYKQSTKGREAIKRYREGDAGRASEKRRRATEKHKLYRKMYVTTSPKYKETVRRRKKEYRKSESYRAYELAYSRSETAKKTAKRIRESEHGKLQRKAINSRYRTRKAMSGGSFTSDEFAALCDYYGNLCACCGKGGIDLEADHVVPVACGGNSSIGNIQPLCRSCNASKAKKTVDYRYKGLPVTLRQCFSGNSENSE